MEDFPIKVGNLEFIGNIKRRFGCLSRRGVQNDPKKLGIIRGRPLKYSSNKNQN